MSFTRRHYEGLAKALKDARAELKPGWDAVEVISWNAGVTIAAEKIGKLLADINPRFDSARFLRDAGVKPLGGLNDRIG